MGDKGKGGVKNLKKWVTLFMEDPNNKIILMLKATKSIKKTTESSRNFNTCKNTTSTPTNNGGRL